MYLKDVFNLFDVAMAGVRAKATRRSYKQSVGLLIEFLDNPNVERITLSDLRRWRAVLANRDYRWVEHPYKPVEKGGLSPWTLHRHIRSIRRFFGWCVDEGILVSSPAERLELPKLPKHKAPRSVDAISIDRILKVALDGCSRDYALVRFVGDTGCRVGGVVGLQLNDVDLSSRHAMVCEKGDKTRRVFFTEETANALNSYLTERTNCNSSYVFVGRYGKPLTESGVYQVFKRLAKKAGITGRFNPHAWRHAWADRALRRGARLEHISEALGHSSSVVTKQFYLVWDDRIRQETHEKYGYL